MDVGPLEAEKRQLQEHLNGIQREMQGLLGVAKAGGDSRETAQELQRLETAKSEVTVQIAQLEAIIAHRKQAVYDVDAVQGLFKRFALFINRIPVEMKVQIIRLMVEQVIVSNSQLEVKLHELPVGILHNALTKSGAGWDGRKVVFRGDGFAKRQGAKPTTNKNCHRITVAVFEYNWRGRRPANTTEPFTSEVDKTYFPYSEMPLMPAFSVLCGLEISQITNGERLLEETAERFALPELPYQSAKVQIPPSYRTAGLQLATAC